MPTHEDHVSVRCRCEEDGFDGGEHSLGGSDFDVNEDAVGVFVGDGCDALGLYEQSPSDRQ